MLTVNITGSAIGTALMSSTSATGKTSTMGTSPSERRHQRHSHQRADDHEQPPHHPRGDLLDVELRVSALDELGGSTVVGAGEDRRRPGPRDPAGHVDHLQSRKRAVEPLLDRLERVLDGQRSVRRDLREDPLRAREELPRGTTSFTSPMR